MAHTASTTNPLSLAVLISGGGRTMVNLADVIRRGELNARIDLVVASRPDAQGIERAQGLGIERVEVVERKAFDSIGTFSDAVWAHIADVGADLACLAGFMCLLRIPDAYLGRAMNIHPALLPKYGGKGMYGHHVHEAVVAAGETESGCTVHFCDNQYDTGPIILQRRCPVDPGDTPDDVAARVFEQECLAYPEAVGRFAAGQLDGLRAGMTA